MTITVTGIDPEYSFAVQLVLRDALYEFMHTRLPVDEYVNRRYAEHPQSFRVTKLDEVKHRLELAQMLREADVFTRP